MFRPILIVAAVAIAGIVLLAPARGRDTETISQVFVTNFPEVQRVEGKIGLDGPVKLAALTSFTNVVVPPVPPTETTRLVQGGTLETAGFPSVVLSLHGQVKGSVVRRGDVGAILIPDQPTIQDAFNDLGIVHFALRTVALGVSIDTAYFASEQSRHIVGFDSYKVYFYNTTDKAATVNLYAYLTN